jgi:hypothetical protein
VVAMRVSDDGTVYRLPRVDEEIAGFTIEAAVGEAEKGHSGKVRRGSG